MAHSLERAIASWMTLEWVAFELKWAEPKKKPCRAARGYR